MTPIPLSPVPSQTLKVNLAGQACDITVYLIGALLYCDLAVAGLPIISARLIRDRVQLVRYAYLGFVGDLAMVDTQGTEDPQYLGLGARWQLTYL